MNQKLVEISEQFSLVGSPISIEPYGNGHIHDTFCVTCKKGVQSVRYILQRLNQEVFKQPNKVMDNISRIVAHLDNKQSAQKSLHSKTRSLHLIKANDGGFWFEVNNAFWRLFSFVEGTYTIEVVTSKKIVYEAAAAFARFQHDLIDLPGPNLHETIPDFHNTTKRLAQFEEALSADVCGRAKECSKEIILVKKYEELAYLADALMKSKNIPKRVVHNDTKVNNVLFDKKSDQGVCVIDLDTVMPGSILFDFGDMVRTATVLEPEDSSRCAKMTIQKDLFCALVKGYLSEAKVFITPDEIDNLVFSAKLITFEVGVRFLTDYLAGDRYFKTDYKEHNLVRCRNQFQLLNSLEVQEKELEKIVQNLL